MKDKTVLRRVEAGGRQVGRLGEGGSVFRWNYKAGTHQGQNTFSHYVQVFICFRPSKSKVCVISVLFSPRDIHNNSLAAFPPGACYTVG